MNDEAKAAVMVECSRLLDKLEDEAVAGERERCVERVRQAKRELLSSPVFITRDEAIDAILGREAAPEPPPPEPMTVERLMEILRSRHASNGFCDTDWPDVKAELEALVQTQARRCADTCARKGCLPCSYATLKAAGLE